MIGHLRGCFGVEPVCRVLDLCPGAYYGRKRRPPSARAQRDAVLLEQIKDVYQASYGTYGVYRVHKQFHRHRVQVARCMVERLMRGGGLQGVRRGDKRRTTVVDEAAPGHRTWSTGALPPIAPISCGWPTSSATRR